MPTNPIPSIAYPLINGNRYDWSSIELKLAGQIYVGVKSLNFDEELTPGEVYGTHAQIIGRTRGELKVTGSFELYVADADIFIAGLAALGGYLETRFNVGAQYLETPVSTAPTTRDLLDCRVTKISEGHSQGSDALTTKFDIHVMRMLRNGAAPLSKMLGAQ